MKTEQNRPADFETDKLTNRTENFSAGEVFDTVVARFAVRNRNLKLMNELKTKS